MQILRISWVHVYCIIFDLIKGGRKSRDTVPLAIKFQHQKHDQKEQKAESSFESISLKKKRNYKINYLK